MTNKQDYIILNDEDGSPVLISLEEVKELLLAGGGAPDNRPPPGAGVIDPDTVSGNSAHDPSTGKFGFKGQRHNAQVMNASADELDRRFDAVREAAREFEQFDVGDAEDFLKGKTNRTLTAVELQQFVLDVQDQRLNDIVDVLDQNLKRGLGKNRRARRFVRVQAPRGFTRKTLVGFEDQSIQKVADRLRAKGWTDDELRKGLVNRFSGDRRNKLSGLIGID